MTVQPTRDQLRALADKATEGPWMHDRDQNDGWMVVFGGNEYPHGYNIIGSNEYLEPEDAAFIAAARTALPQLLDQLDQQEAIIRRQERYIEELESVDAVGLTARATQAEAERDRWHSMWRQRGIKHLAAEKRATRAEARIKAVHELLDENPAAYATVYSNNIRRALDGDA